MTHDSSRSLTSSFPNQIELELLNLILDETANYPWNPADPEAEAYFAALEQEVMNAGWTSAELTEAGQRLATTFDQLWATETVEAPVVELAQSPRLSDLFQQFTAQVPQQMIDAIVSRARRVMSSNLSLADQLVHSVQECLPNWAEEDLQVLARPFAYAMRGGAESEMLESALRSVRCAAWTDLSGIEQARLSLAIARYAIAQMPAKTEE